MPLEASIGGGNFWFTSAPLNSATLELADGGAAIPKLGVSRNEIPVKALKTRRMDSSPLRSVMAMNLAAAFSERQTLPGPCQFAHQRKQGPGPRFLLNQVSV